MARQMKDSGVEWIGVIPKDWSVSATKYLFKIQSGTTPDSKKEEFWDGDIRWVTPADFKTDDVYVERGRRNISDLGFASCSLQIIPTGSIIFSKRAPVGSVVISNADLSINQGCLACMNKGQSITKYYYYVMSIATEQYELRSSGTTFKEISACTFSNFTLPLPPNDSQRVIADYIDAKSSLICNIIEQTRVTIEKYKKLKQAIITEAVTKGVRGARPMKSSGVEWIGDIPEEWDLLKTLWLLEMPITDGPHETPTLYDDGIPFISAEAVSCGRGGIDFSHKRGYISREYYDECCKKYTPRLHDIYMIKSGATTGRVSMVDTEELFTIWSPLAVLRANQEKMLPRFLFYSLQADYYQKQISLSWSFGTQQNIGMRVLEQLKIATPDTNEQQEIAAYLDTKCAEIDRIIEKKEQLIEELGSYKKSLIYEYVTGKKEVTA